MNYEKKYYKYKVKYINLRNRLVHGTGVLEGGNPFRLRSNYDMHTIITDAIRFKDGANHPLHVPIQETVTDGDIRKVRFNEISSYLLPDMEEAVRTIDDGSYILCIGYPAKMTDGSKVDGDAQIGLTGTVEGGEEFKVGSLRELSEEASISPDTDDSFELNGSKSAKLNIRNAIVDSGAFSGGAKTKTNVVIHGSEADIRAKIKDMAQRQHAYQTHRQGEIDRLDSEIDILKRDVLSLEEEIRTLREDGDAKTDMIREKEQSIRDLNISKTEKEQDKKKLKYDKIRYYLFMNKAAACNCIDTIKKMATFWNLCKPRFDVSAYFVYDFEDNKAIYFGPKPVSGTDAPVEDLTDRTDVVWANLLDSDHPLKGDGAIEVVNRRYSTTNNTCDHMRSPRAGARSWRDSGASRGRIDFRSTEARDVKESRSYGSRGFGSRVSDSRQGIYRSEEDAPAGKDSKDSGKERGLYGVKESGKK